MESNPFGESSQTTGHSATMEVEELSFNEEAAEVVQVTSDIGYTTYSIKDDNGGIFEVMYRENETVAACTCKKFEQDGLICRHMFVIFKNLKTIPAKYLPTRWMKAASLIQCTQRGRLYQFEGGEEANRSLNSLWADFHCCIALARGRIDKIEELSGIILTHKDKMLSKQAIEATKTCKKAIMETYCGSTSEIDITVLPPKQAKNKGSGSRIKSRLQSQKEKAIKASTKLRRRCGICGEVTTHNSRTCPKRTTMLP
ncbi:hypothetical protein DH2020_007718 [Rehmannia glutinosa]|uniref:SWIM-type domain-containing protein n=1 Tax=Rehmannia glutinosa TaxID=99300 RepID=A0ABR0TYY5_REHGL